jgi:hypothetical protein
LQDRPGLPKDDFFDPFSKLTEDLRAILIITTLAISAAILFLPFLGEAWADAEIRFLLFLVLLVLVALMLIRWTAPMTSEYEVMPPLQDSFSHVEVGGNLMEQALGGQPYGQLKMYLELRTVFLERVRTRRRLDDTGWRLLLSDRPRFQALVGDPDLFMLMHLEDRGTADLAQYSNLGLAFGRGFAERFGTLLGKVEQWT